MYHYPFLSGSDIVFVRALGPGLGNLLFPQATLIISGLLSTAYYYSIVCE